MSTETLSAVKPLISYHKTCIALSEIDTGRVEVCTLMQCTDDNAGRQDHRGLYAGYMSVQSVIME